MTTDTLERNRRILLARLDGMSYKALGKSCELSPERVRQIVVRERYLLLSAERRRQQAEERCQQLRESRSKLAALLAAVRDESGIDDLDLSVRARRCLRAAGIETLEGLIQKSTEELLSLPNLGPRTLQEIRWMLASHEASLRNDPGADDIERRLRGQF